MKSESIMVADLLYGDDVQDTLGFSQTFEIHRYHAAFYTQLAFCLIMGILPFRIGILLIILINSDSQDANLMTFGTR